MASKLSCKVTANCDHKEVTGWNGRGAREWKDDAYVYHGQSGGSLRDHVPEGRHGVTLSLTQHGKTLPCVLGELVELCQDGDLRRAAGESI